MKETLSELKSDFEEVLKCIDFKCYDPHSRIFARALKIGLMYSVIKTVSNSDDISEELNGARNYMLSYLETNDNVYKDMASDELRHAGILIKKQYEKSKDKEKLECYENERQTLLSRIAKWKEE